MATLQVQQFGRTARRARRPQHTFIMSVKPWAITPFFIAPVLPGETMKNLLMQARVVTDPINNPLIGWWCEFYFFYCKHRDLNERDQLTNMMIDPSVVLATTGSRVDSTYTFNGGVDFVTMCLKRVTECYFRDTNETWNTNMMGSFPCAQITQQTALDSAIMDSDYLAGTADNIVVGADDTITGAELSQSWILWQQYRASNITHLSYEEYLATYGIPLPQGSDGEHRPELVRYVKDWSYPTNTVDPATGSPTSALSWAVAERADKDRFFREPGFLFGVVCVRPKCYLAQQGGAVTGALKDALAWLPAVMGDNPEYSVRLFPASTGPYPATAAGYRVDLKDLFLYGDQHSNVGLYDTTAAGGYNRVTLPGSSMGKKYPTPGDADNLFKVKTGTPPPTAVRMDGVVSLNILGMQQETTPTRAPGTF
jgi:hypothetical protein